MRRPWRVVLVVVGVLAIAVGLVIGRGPIARLALELVVPRIVGYDLRLDDVLLDGSHAALIGVHVSRKGDPVVDAARVDLDYHLRDLFPGGTRKFGFVAASIAHPTITLVRHRDGSFNVSGGTVGGSSVPAATRAQAQPYYFTVRVRDGSLVFRDLGAAHADTSTFTVDGVALDASIKTNSRSSYHFKGTIRSAPDQAAGIRAYPVRIDGAVDYDRGFAIHHLTAAAVPLRGPLAAILHTPAVRFDAGEARALDLRIFAVNIRVDHPFAYRVGGSAAIAGGRIALGAFALPVRDLAGPVTFYDDGLATRGITGTIAGVGITARGGLFDLAHPTFRLAITGAGDLHALRHAFAFATKQPLAGGVRLGALIENGISQPLILVNVDAPHVSYAGVPFDAGRGSLAYYDSSLTLAPFSAGYGAAHLRIAGRLILPTETRALDTALLLLADARARDIPYATELVPAVNDLRVAALLSGLGTRFRLAGSLAGAGGGTNVSAFFAVDERGYGSYGPLAIDRPGESLVGGVRLDRRAGYDAAWLTATHLHVGPGTPNPGFPGAHLPVFPPISGDVDGQAAAAGPSDDIGIAGNVRINDVVIAGIRANHASARLAGSFADLRLEDVAFAAPFGTFDGRGAIDGGRVALTGAFTGSFEGLRAFTGDLGAHGVVSGPASLVADTHGVVLQLDGGRARAEIHGVPLTGLSGTLAVDAAKRLRIVAADADLAGGRAVASGTDDGETAFSTSALDVRSLGLGATLDGGRIDAFGQARLPAHAGAPTQVDAGFALSGGSARGYPVDARASLGLDGDRLRIGGGFALVAGTEATFDGSVAGLGATPTYDLTAGVRDGDLAIVRRNVAALGTLRSLDGSVDANVRVTGRGVDPRVVGGITIPEGSYNGLAFHDVRAQVDARAGALGLRAGSARIGSTNATFAGSLAGDRMTASLRADHADLGDFNDYFDAGDTLAGVGRIRLGYDGTAERIRTHGDIALAGLRYRTFALGDMTLAWSDANAAGNRVTMRFGTTGPTGTLTSQGTIGLRPGGPSRAFHDPTLAVRTSLRDLDLAVWLPAAGLQYPVVGRLDADAEVNGRYPRLDVTSQAHVRQGAVAGVALQRFDLAARTVDGRTTITQADIDIPNATLRGSGTFGVAPTSPLDLTLTGTAPDVATFLAKTLHRPYDVAGALTTNVRVTGTLGEPQIAGGFDVIDPRVARFAAQRAFGALALDGPNVKLLDAEIQLSHGTLALSGEIPLLLDPTVRLGPSTAPLSFLVESSDVDIADLAPLLGNATRLTGALNGRFGVDGTVGTPRLVGNLALANGSYVSNLERQPLTNLSAQATFTGANVRLQALHATAGKGSIDGSGTALLPIVPGSALTYSVAFTAKGAQVDLPQYLAGTVDGTVRIERTGAYPIARGGLALTNATIPVAAIYNPSAPPPDPNAPPPLELGLDLTLAAGKNVRVRNAFIDVGATGEVAVGGTLAAPQLDGEFVATNGTFNILTTAFRVQSAHVNFTPDAGLVPNVDLRALARVSSSRDSFDVTTIVRGPSNNLSTSFASDRNYSKDEILAYLSGASALGFNASQQAQLPGTLKGIAPVENALTPPQLIRVPNSAFSLSEAGFDILNTQLTQRFFSPFENFFAQTLGLTSFGVNLDYTGGIGFTARKEVRRDLYLVYGQTVTTPVRETLGIEARPNQYTSLQFTGFTQQGVATYIGNGSFNQFGNATYVRTTANLPIGSQSGFSLTLTKRYP